MIAQQYVQLLNQPYNITNEALQSLDELIDKYPYLQSARVLRLKLLHAQRSFLYNNELKKTAAYTTDRDVLFDYIISEDFITFKPIEIANVNVYDADLIFVRKPEPTLDETIEKRVLDTLVYIENQDKETELIHKIDQISKSKSEAKLEKSLEDISNQPTAIIEIDDTPTPSIETNNIAEEIEEKLEVGTPLEFSDNDKFSFSEWLKLTSTTPIERENDKEIQTTPIIEESLSIEIQDIKTQDKQDKNEIPIEIVDVSTGEIIEVEHSKSDDKIQRKMDLIDKFIEANPKIVPSKTAAAPTINLDRGEEEEPYYMTETLARIYLEQKKYQKAIQAYEILILKYPEKSSLFANRINDIKKLQEFNNI